MQIEYPELYHKPKAYYTSRLIKKVDQIVKGPIHCLTYTTEYEEIKSLIKDGDPNEFADSIDYNQPEIQRIEKYAIFCHLFDVNKFKLSDLLLEDY